LIHELPSKQEAQAELARRSLMEFIRQAWHVVEPGTPYIHGWHVEAIAEHLEAVTNGQIRNLLVNIPPGHLKSLLISVFWPAWQWLRRPEWRGLFSSYSIDLSLRDSVRCRSIIESDWYKKTFEPEWSLSSDQNVKSYFQNTRMGFRLSLSVGGKATGFRGDAVIVDDPLNVIDQHSKVAREEAIFWWNNAMSSRLNDMRKGAKVIIMQRLHEEDLSGYVLEQGGYEHLCLPSEFDSEHRARTSIGWEDPRSADGELLFSEMFPREVLEEAKKILGSSGYSGQHQQRPSPAGGTIFQRSWWKFFRALPDDIDEMIQSWDLTFKDADGSDYVVGQVWARKGSACYLLDQVRDRMTFTSTCAAIKALSAKWPRASLKLVEDKANGPAVIDSLSSEVGGIVAVTPDGSKEARAHSVSPQIEAGNVHLPENAPWVNDFLEECAVFPFGANDDQVDTMTQALRRFSTNNFDWMYGVARM
jgi:predicted phage terminase large subunit-like protein